MFTQGQAVPLFTMRPIFCLLLVAFLLPSLDAKRLICRICTAFVGSAQEALENDDSSIDEIAKEVCEKHFKDNFIEHIVCNTLSQALIPMLEDDIRDQAGSIKNIKAC
ncbi:hypothetical protein QR680_017998 [Steinernema hermaphroditum]|uniref:Saposin B-type domain-containing protein n=1 Tax=Steinernema hermaphroditum TaxID=289476 RepID=A0AA39LQB1_9BILA|nr:hypothetical protein QR680_017998 [Steinernema hermaphroditum]